MAYEYIIENYLPSDHLMDIICPIACRQLLINKSNKNLTK